MKFEVLTESETLEACHRFSISRFGDGELRLAAGGGCSSQKPDPRLAAELRQILKTYEPWCMVGVPNFDATPRKDVWNKYRSAQFLPFFGQPTYGSAFITRPDNAPWIDTPEYWDAVRGLWADQDVTLVTGDEKSITPEMLRGGRGKMAVTTLESCGQALKESLLGAESVRVVKGPRQHAYAEIDAIEEAIGTPAGLVVLCLGATATVLAARLARKGVHALDLGHIGMFMRHAGAFAIGPEKLASPEYRRQLQAKHASMKWGKSGHSHVPEIRPFLKKLNGRSILDYGCGQGTIRPAMPEVKVFEYDPGIVGKDQLPKPADLVACTDVLEHIEPALLDGVLRHIFDLAGKGAYLVIATRLARETLPDGRNAHLIVKNSPWWIEKLKQVGWRTIRHESRKGLCVWLEK